MLESARHLTRQLPRQLRRLRPGPARPRNPDIVTASGLSITFDETAGAESITLTAPGGPQVRLGGSPPHVTVEDGNGNTVELGPVGIAITAAGSVTIQASTVKVTAGMLDLETATVRTPGIVQCGTLIAQSVVAASYTPGAGNVW